MSEDAHEIRRETGIEAKKRRIEKAFSVLADEVFRDVGEDLGRFETRQEQKKANLFKLAEWDGHNLLPVCGLLSRFGVDVKVMVFDRTDHSLTFWVDGRQSELTLGIYKIPRHGFLKMSHSEDGKDGIAIDVLTAQERARLN
jgi:hypothetical protein